MPARISQILLGTLVLRSLGRRGLVLSLSKRQDRVEPLMVRGVENEGRALRP